MHPATFCPADRDCVAWRMGVYLARGALKDSTPAAFHNLSFPFSFLWAGGVVSTNFSEFFLLYSRLVYSRSFWPGGHPICLSRDLLYLPATFLHALGRAISSKHVLGSARRSLDPHSLSPRTKLCRFL